MRQVVIFTQKIQLFNLIFVDGLTGVGPYISGPNYFRDPFIEKFSRTRDTSFDLFFIWPKL
jgi:hypothetical protein